MDKSGKQDGDVGDLPFHEYCANCNKRFDDTILDPTVTIVETSDERALHSFCDEKCLAEWAPDES